ncbi:MAG: ABC transporter substrate-binding protein, partial [Ilumatobacteraceae bacterium]
PPPVVPGGRIVYGLEAETGGGWCLPESLLATSGITVARAVYDTLTVPNEDGAYVPWLAESVEPNADFTSWTITVRPGVTFHDGSALTADVVKRNLDAYRGAYEGRSPVLFRFILEDISAVEVVDELTVRVDMTAPWSTFDAHLFSSGRLGMMAQAQLDDPDTCDRQLIGTGPFVFGEWVPNDHLTVVRNAGYWATDPDGDALPYLDEIEFRPVVEPSQRVNAIEAGQLDVLQTHEEIAALRDLAEAGVVSVVESDQFSEVDYLLLNSSRPPFDNIHARLAVAHAIDRETMIEVRLDGIAATANGPFSPDEPGHLEDSGLPSFDLDRAREEVALYEQETGQPLEFTISHGNREAAALNAQFTREMLEQAGMTVNLPSGGTEQAQYISDAIAGNFQLMGWRNHAGPSPDTEYVFWHSGSPANFGRIADPEIDRLLDAGRASGDAAERDGVYADLNRRFAEQVYNVWTHHVPWAVASDPDVHGVYGPPLPDGSAASPGLALGHPLLGLWIEQ